MSDELEQRVARLEEQVFGNESDEDVMEKLAFLQSKLRDAGEQFEDVLQRIESAEAKMERLQSEEEIVEDMERIRKQINRERDEIESEFADAQNLIDVLDERLEEIGDEKQEIQGILNDVYEAGEVIVERIREPQEAIATVQMWMQFHNTRVVTERIPACEESEMLMKLYENAHKMSSDDWTDVNSILLTYVQNVEDWSERSGIDFTASPQMFRIFLASEWQKTQIEGVPKEEADMFMELPEDFVREQVPESLRSLDESVGKLMDSTSAEDPMDVYTRIIEEHGQSELSFLLMMRELGDMKEIRAKAQELIESFQVSEEEYERKLQEESLREELT